MAVTAPAPGNAPGNAPGKAAGNAPGNPLQAFYQTPGVPLSSGPDRARRQARLLTGILCDLNGPAVIVDLGCGDGAALAVAAKQNPEHRFAGIDWSADALRQARARGLTVVRGTMETRLPVADGAADVVIMSELIEHLVDPDRAVAEARRVLRPSGALLLSTPNLAAWYNRGLLAVGIQPVFSEVSLTRSVRQAGPRGGRPPAPVHPAGADRVPDRQRLPLRERGRGALPRRAAANATARPGLLPLAVGRVHPAGPRPEAIENDNGAGV